MEPHAVPQNVTTFQFKLIGDMTLKQFLYLAAGCGIAYFLFVFAVVKYPFFAWPAIVISTLLGAAFAFLPIQARPLDQWLNAFFKAIYSPTKRVWKKMDKSYNEDPLFKSRLLAYMSAITPPQQIPPTPQIPNPPKVSTPSTKSPKVSEPLPTHSQLKQTVDLAKQAQSLQMKIIQTERQLNQIKTQAQQPTPLPIDYSQQVNKILSDLQTLVSQASDIKKQIETVTEGEEEVVPIIHQPVVKPEVKIIIPEKQKQTQLALTSFPNVINGVIKDSQANFLEAVVVVIYDKEGLPVRALKTNKLGQFSGSTPLPNGTYKIELEKDDFTFDLLQIELSGQILSPLQISAKEAINP